MAPKLLLVADIQGWIFERHCFELKKRLSDEFDIEIGYRGQNFDQKRYDLIYAMEYGCLPNPRHPEKTVAGIRGEFRYGGRPNKKFLENLQRRYTALHVVNSRMRDHFRQAGADLPNLPHGVDITLFNDRPRDQDGDLVCGWTGSSASSEKGQGILESINLPGVELVTLIGQCRWSGTGERVKTKEQMVDFYQGLDVYLCASVTEGHNNPLMEASAMGRPLISTDTGSAQEYIDGSNGWIVERSTDAFEEKLLYLRDNRSKTTEMGERARQVTRELWSWDRRAEDYRSFFRNNLG